jgi:low affinity Fe/Cu permease
MAVSHGVRWWLARQFDRDRRVETILNLASIALGVFGVVDLYSRFWAWATQEPLQQFNAYIWTTFTATIILMTGAIFIDRSIRRDRREMRKHAAEIAAQEEATAVREDAIVLQHRMIEEVRRCAELRERYDYNEHMQRVARGLQDFLRRRLGGQRYSITVKRTDVATKKLQTVFRDVAQEPTRRSWDIDQEESVAYRRFLRETKNPRKWILIKDTERLPGSDSKYSERARRCGYRSVLAFPLRLPVALPPKDSDPDVLKCANLLGFVSIDAPEADAFAGLFLPPKEGIEPRDDGEDLAPCADQDLFYGLADACATIVMLQSGRSNDEQAVHRGGHHDDGNGDPDHSGKRAGMRSGPDSTS